MQQEVSELVHIGRFQTDQSSGHRVRHQQRSHRLKLSPCREASSVRTSRRRTADYSLDIIPHNP